MPNVKKIQTCLSTIQGRKRCEFYYELMKTENTVGVTERNVNKSDTDQNGVGLHIRETFCVSNAHVFQTMCVSRHVKFLKYADTHLISSSAPYFVHTLKHEYVWNQ